MRMFALFYLEVSCRVGSCNDTLFDHELHSGVFLELDVATASSLIGFCRALLQHDFGSFDRYAKAHQTVPFGRENIRTGEGETRRQGDCEAT